MSDFSNDTSEYLSDLSNQSWSESIVLPDTAFEAAVAGDAAAVEGDQAAWDGQLSLNMAESTAWSAGNAESWGDWNADIAEDNALSAASYYETAESAIASGDYEFAQTMIDDGNTYAQDAADGYETAADGYETGAGYNAAASWYAADAETSATDAAEAYGTAAYAYGTAAEAYDASSYDASSYDASSYDTSSYDTSAYDAGTEV